MKTIRFVREPNTVNEYTSDSWEDCTGNYINKDELMDEIEMLLADSDSAAADFLLLQLLTEIN
jgi:hypothetical protein